MTADPLFEELSSALDSRREARWLLDELDGCSPAQRRELALALASRRLAGEPLQYVLGHWPFRTLDLVLDARALIPRPETELLVDRALDVLDVIEERAVVCDLGCGSGAIALSIAVEARARGAHVDVLATDVSRDALALAALNAARTGTEVSFFEGSWFEAIPAAYVGELSLVCSNPPYVGCDERPHLARELDFEPSIALVAADGSDGTPGMGALETIIAGAARWLAPGGTLVLEHGADQRDAVVACCGRAGLVLIRDHVDLAGLPRIVQASRPR